MRHPLRVVTGRWQSSSAASKVRTSVSKPELKGVDNIIAVASGKGGVGKSTTAVNLAVALALACKLQVGLLDADVYGPSIPTLMKLHGRPQIDAESKMIPLENFGVRCMSMGFLMDKDAAAVWRGPMVRTYDLCRAACNMAVLPSRSLLAPSDLHMDFPAAAKSVLQVMSALEKLVRGVVWGKLDVLVVDMPPGTGDTQISISQRLPLAGAVIVSTPQDIALIDARRGVSMFRKVDVPVLGLIENMSYFKCPNCGDRTDVFGHGGARATAVELNMDFLGEVPLDIAIRETSDQGSPIVASAPDSELALVYKHIANQVAAKLKVASGYTSWPRIVVE